MNYVFLTVYSSRVLGWEVQQPSKRRFPQRQITSRADPRSLVKNSAHEAVQAQERVSARLGVHHCTCTQRRGERFRQCRRGCGILRDSKYCARKLPLITVFFSRMQGGPSWANGDPMGTIQSTAHYMLQKGSEVDIHGGGR